MKKFTLFVLVMCLSFVAMAQGGRRAVRLTGNTLETMSSATTDASKAFREQKMNVVGKSQQAKRPMKVQTRADEAVEPEVIMEQPEGELKVYTRDGGSYFSFFGYLISAPQSGTIINMVYAPDGKTIYMENPISQAQFVPSSWVKGTIEGNKIHMPMGQYLMWFGDAGYQLKVLKLGKTIDPATEEETMGYIPTDEKEVTFTIDEQTGAISLDLKSRVDPLSGMANQVLGIILDSDNSWTDWADYSTVYTPFSDKITTAPETLASEQWAMLYFDGNYDSALTLNVAIDGDKMYVSGISEADPEAAIVGTIKGDKVVFANDQFVGLSTGYVGYVGFTKYEVTKMYDEMYDEWYDDYLFTPLPEAELAYDKENKTLTAGSDMAILLNAGKTSVDINYISVYLHPKFLYFEEVAAKPSDPEILGYADYFEDYGYDMISFNIKLEDTNGKYIDKDKVSYIMYVKVDGEEEPYVFYSDEYVGLEAFGLEEITEIPYNFVIYDSFDYEDISLGGTTIVIYQTGFDDFGVQTVYYGGGERNVSNIVWMNGGNEDAIASAKAAGKAAAIFDLTGRKSNNLGRGVNIVRGEDGAVRKVIVK